LAWVIATWFGSGLSPIAPGTAGSLAAIPLYLVAVRGGRAGVAVAALAATAAGVWASTRVARRIGKKDPQVVVVDEVAGLLVTMLPFDSLSVRGLALGFITFRLFDALKPWPIRALERLPEGWGIVLDDVAAGAASAGVMAAVRSAGWLA
jgi:phosphatidylglycerophosphatase A